MTDQRNGFLGAVGRFFFLPTDPTTLGFMRIMTGLLLLYVHAAYSLALEEFFGPHAWWDHQAANRQRLEVPVNPPPLGWDTFQPNIYLDDAPHRRSALIEYLKSLPEKPEQRRSQLRYLHRLFQLPPQTANEGLYMANSAARLDQNQLDAVRAALMQNEVPAENIPLHVPEFIRQLPKQERVTVWDDLLAFNAGLPNDHTKQEYVLFWLGNYAYHLRFELYRFLAGEKKEGGQDMSLPADPKERAEFLAYLELWNGDARQATSKGTSFFSWWYHLTDPTSMWAVHIVCLVIFALFTIGLWTRVTSVLAWTASLGYIHRSELVLFGQDTMQTILITYLMIGPCGAALSIDALRKRYRASRALMSSGGRSVPWADAVLAGPQPSWLANLAIRLFQINFCFIYMSSGVSKLKGSTWWQHEAAWLVLVNPEFGLIRYEIYEWFLRQIVEWRVMLSVFAGFVTLYTLVVEIGLPLLIWTRIRPLMVSLSAMLHLGIGIIMGLAVFSMYMYTLLLCYFPARLIRDRLCWAPGSGKKMTLRYDSRDPTAVRKAALVRAFDVAGQVTFVDAAGKDEADRLVHLTTPDAREVTGRELYSTALKELVLLRSWRWLGQIPGVWPVVSWWFGR